MGDVLNAQIKERIVHFLKKNKEWAHSSEVAQAIGHNRITVGKYLDVMLEQGMVTRKNVGRAKLWKIHKKEQVLICDDEVNIINLIKLTLTDTYDFLEGHNGQEAIDKTVTHHPDLLILDLMMPQKTGFDVLKELKSHIHTKEIPILILSAKGDTKSKLKCMQLGATEFIEKPFDPKELEAHVKQILQKQEGMQQLHPVTHLPGAIPCLSFLNTKSEKEPVYTVHITHFEEYTAQFGYKRATESLQLIAKILQTQLESPQNEYFLGHYQTDSFLLTTKDTNIVQKIQTVFDSYRDFFYATKDAVQKGQKMQCAVEKLQEKDEILTLKNHISNL